MSSAKRLWPEDVVGHGFRVVREADYDRDTQALKDDLAKWRDLAKETRIERDELRAQLEAMRADAERYRWMRSSFVRNHKHSLIWYLPMMTQLTAEGLDENVDAALQAEPRGTAE